MKVNRLEAHDRLLHLREDQAQTVARGVEDCLKLNADSLALQEKSPYIYIFAHPRTADDGVNKRLLWQPRLIKPKAEENSFLFRATSKTDLLTICWMIPEKHLWEQYKKGNVTEHEIAIWSINMFQTNKAELEKPEPDDWSEEQAARIWLSIIEERRQEIRMKRLFPFKPKSAEPFSLI